MPASADVRCGVLHFQLLFFFQEEIKNKDFVKSGGFLFLQKDAKSTLSQHWCIFSKKKAKNSKKKYIQTLSRVWAIVDIAEKKSHPR